MTTTWPATSPRSAPNTGDLIAGKYRLGRELGRGGMGIVFEATNTITERRFALKWLSIRGDDGIERFRREAKLASRVHHPNVVDVYDMQMDKESSFLVMELLEGESLADRLAEKGALHPFAAREIMMLCLAGVAAVHAVGVIHRDLKPDNIFLCDRTGILTPKILDFGISQASRALKEGSLEAGGTIAGTPLYMAPEQLLGQACDERTDVYALGLTYYAMLTGVDAFSPAVTLQQLKTNIFAGEMRPLQEHAPHVSRALVEVIARAAAPSPEQRYATALDFAKAIRQVSGTATTYRLPIRPPAARTWAMVQIEARRSKWWTLGGALAAVGGIAALITSLSNGSTNHTASYRDASESPESGPEVTFEQPLTPVTPVPLRSDRFTEANATESVSVDRADVARDRPETSPTSRRTVPASAFVEARPTPTARLKALRVVPTNEMAVRSTLAPAEQLQTLPARGVKPRVKIGGM